MNGVTGTRPNAPFVGKVPTGKRATVDEIENDLPDYTAEPKVWEHAMRPRMYTVLKAHGIASPVVTTPIITAALAAAKAKKPGDVRTAWQMLSKYRRAALREQREYAAEKRRISEIRDWLIGPCGLPTPTVREMMKQSGTELQDRPLIERITDITMMAIDRQFNAHGQNKKHWAANYANPPVADFWQHVTDVAEENDWGLQERIGKLNIALGSVASIYWYPGTLEQARAAFDKTYCDKGDETVVAPAKDYATNPVAARYAIPAHMAKGLNVTENEIGTHVVKCFGGRIDKYIDQHGPEQALKTADDYILKLNAKPAADIKPADPDGSRADFANITADRTPHIGDASAEAPERQSKPVEAAKPVVTRPDSVPATSKQEPRQSGTEKANGDETVKPVEKKILQFTPAPAMLEVKTLMGIPAGDIAKVLNLKHHEKAYKRIKAKNNDEFWTDLDPIAVRKRFDKVFGPQGFGWRLIPAPGVGKVDTTSEVRTSKAGRDYTMFRVNFVAFQFEYALSMPDGKIQYVQTSAFSDSDENEDAGYAYRGAFTSLMKQTLKMFGGFDHFADKTA